MLSQWMDKLMAKQVPPELQLDLLDAACGARTDLTPKLKKFESARDAKDPLASYRECEAGGDVERRPQDLPREGRGLVHPLPHRRGHRRASSARDSTASAKRQTREYLLESIVYPNAKIAPGFETVVVKHQGRQVPHRRAEGENDKELELLNPDLEPEKQRIVIRRTTSRPATAARRRCRKASSRRLKKHELRDLVEYLASLKTEPKEETLKHGQ